MMLNKTLSHCRGSIPGQGSNPGTEKLTLSADPEPG